MTLSSYTSAYIFLIRPIFTEVTFSNQDYYLFHSIVFFVFLQ